MRCLSCADVERNPLFSSALLTRYGMTWSTGPNGRYLLTWKPAFLSPRERPSAIPINWANWSLSSPFWIPSSSAFAAANFPIIWRIIQGHAKKLCTIKCGYELFSLQNDFELKGKMWIYKSLCQNFFFKSRERMLPNFVWLKLFSSDLSGFLRFSFLASMIAFNWVHQIYMWDMFLSKF